MATDTLSKKIGAWDALNTNVKARLPELPQLSPTVKDLDELIVEGRELQGVQDVHRRQLRETTQRSKEIVELPRFGGHLILREKGVHDAQTPSALPP